MTGSKKRIAVIGLKGLPAYSGAAAVGESLLDCLYNEYDFTVYSNSANTPLKTGKYKQYYQIVVNSIKHQGANFLWYYFKSAWICLFYKSYDIVHVHHLAGAFIIPILRLKYKNVIATTHGMPDQTDKWKFISWIYYPIMRFLFARFSSVITSVSESDIKHLSPYTNKVINFVPNGIGEMTIDKDFNADETEIFFAAGRIMPIKGCHILLKALISMNFKGKVIIAGDLDQISSYKKELIFLSENLNCEFIGLVREKSILLKYIQSSKLFVFPSIIEAMSMMLLEAAYTKTPIIASDIPQNKAIFNEDEVLFFQSESVEGLAKKIQYAFKHYDTILDKANKANSKVLSEYNINFISEKYSKIFNQCLNQK